MSKNKEPRFIIQPQGRGFAVRWLEDNIDLVLRTLGTRREAEDFVNKLG